MLLLLSLFSAEPRVVATDAAPTYTILDGQGSAALLLNAQNGSEKAALQLLSLNAGAAVAAHTHAESDELLYVLEGTVEMVVGGQKLSAKAGDAVLIPAGVEHSATATSAMRAVQIYAAPGPEQRFTAGKRTR